MRAGRGVWAGPSRESPGSVDVVEKGNPPISKSGQMLRRRYLMRRQSVFDSNVCRDYSLNAETSGYPLRSNHYSHMSIPSLPTRKSTLEMAVHNQVAIVTGGVVRESPFPDVMTDELIPVHVVRHRGGHHARAREAWLEYRGVRYPSTTASCRRPGRAAGGCVHVRAMRRQQVL